MPTDKAVAKKSSAKDVKTIQDWFRAKLTAEKQKFDVVRKVRDGQGDFVIVDARDAESFKAGHLPGAVNVPLSGVEAAVKTLPKDREIVTYCWNRT